VLIFLAGTARARIVAPDLFALGRDMRVVLRSIRLPSFDDVAQSSRIEYLVKTLEWSK
jgi:hypothetical protein